MSPAAAMAPMASSGCSGSPSLRTTRTSSGTPRTSATSAATITPPRGRPSTTGSPEVEPERRSPRARPAARRSAKRPWPTAGSRPRATAARGPGAGGGGGGRGGAAAGTGPGPGGGAGAAGAGGGAAGGAPGAGGGRSRAGGARGRRRGPGAAARPPPAPPPGGGGGGGGRRPAPPRRASQAPPRLRGLGEGAPGTGRGRQHEGLTGDLLARHPVHGFRGVGEVQHRERDQVAVDLESVVVQVLDRVARLVVARVERIAGRAAPDRRLFLGLDLFGPGEQPAGRDAGEDERLVVTPAGELRVVVGLAHLGVVGLVDVLDRLGTRGNVDRGLERRLVGVVDHGDVVRRAHHVVVHVERDAVALGRRQRLDVVRRAEESQLLAGPEAEPQRVLRLRLRHHQRRLEHGSRTGAVVVDDRTLDDAVEVDTGHDNVVLILAGLLIDNVLVVAP